MVPDAVSEEKVRRVDGRKLRQEGRRDGDGDVPRGRHTAFLVNVPDRSRDEKYESLVRFRRGEPLVLPEDLIFDDRIFSCDHVVHIRGEPLQETGA